MTNPSIFRLLLGDAISDAEIARYSALKEECYREIARGQDRADGRAFARSLDALTAAGVRLAIGSSGVRANLELTVRECGLDGRFAAIAALEDITRGKPDPQVFLVAAARSGVAPAPRVVFEDAPVGIQAAKAAGMYAVGVTNSHPAGPLWDAGADEVVESLVGYDVRPLVAQAHRLPPMTGKSPVSPVLPGSMPESRRTTRRISLASMGVAFLPASRTSSWLIGVPMTPAAAFVTRAKASTSMPACRATIASGTVDMPTTSAPSVGSIRISAGVS